MSSGVCGYNPINYTEPVRNLGLKNSDTLHKYHALECCDWTLGADSLLARYKEDRQLITGLIESDPDSLIDSMWKQDGPLAIDTRCMCQMGHGTVRSPFACAQCKNLRRLIDFRSGGSERPFEIQCGINAGKKMIVSGIPVLSHYMSWNDVSAQRAKSFVDQYRDLMICGTPSLDGMRSITGDPFTIHILITWMINKKFESKGLNHCPLLYTAFICRGIGYTLYEVPSIGNIYDLYKNKTATTTAYSIFTQLLVALSELSTINFSHGAPSMNSICFTKDPVSYKYDGVHVNGPATLQITGLWNSSATFGNVHYYPENIQSSMYVEHSIFVPEITNQVIYCDDANECKPIALYRLTNTTVDIYMAMRHIGFPLYVGSFDLYCFIVSLMCNKSFFDNVMTDPKSYKLWSSMWLSEDIANVETSIAKNHHLPHPEDHTAIDIIRGKWLRCDVVPFLWSLVTILR